MLKYELQKLFNSRLFFLSVILAFGLWAFVLGNTYVYSQNSIVSKSFTFWNKLGSLTLGLVILLVNTKVFFMDTEDNVEEVFNTAKLGRRKLFITRLSASVLFSVILILILIFINLILCFTFNRTPQAAYAPLDIPVLLYYIMQTMSVILGGISLTVCAACICDSFKSHSIALIICGLLYGLSYITRISMVQNFSVFWFLGRGFFSYLMRGNIMSDFSWEMIFWFLWYIILPYLLIIADKKVRLRRKEL